MKNLQVTKKELDQILYDKQFTPEKLIQFLSGDLGDIYNADAGVWEGYTIGEHTIMMMRQFEKYFRSNELPANFDLGIFRLILVLHDIGKPEAIAYGDKNQQHVYTVEKLKNIFDTLVISNKYKDIAVALIEEDSLGEYIRGNKDIDTIAQMINYSATRIEMNTRDFFQLLTIFYRCDAGSYTLDAGGKESLDYLFIFDRKIPSLSFASETLAKIQKLENTRVLQ
ncbi:MAG: hypothetical protein ACKUBY_01900 [Candidatus Moraniibacteriota bacterium]|jgi:hypothetical protein